MTEALAVRELDRVRKALGDLFVAANYPGGPKQMHRDLVSTENERDRMFERAAFAQAVLCGNADDHVQAWYRRNDDALCDHCCDLSARLLREARNRALTDRDRAEKLLSRARWLINTGLRGLVGPVEYFDTEALLTKLAKYFQIEERPTDG